jgi:carbon-monoxide dehydrogenase medium subunit
MVRVLTARALRQLRDGTEREGWPEQPVLLWGGKKAGGQKSKGAEGQKGRGAGEYKSVGGEIRVILNGVPTTLRGVQGKTLLRALRENAGLTGTKEGCAEGECGACTVWLDGMAVMSCLVPAERADGCEVVTIEGLANLAPPAPPFAGEEQEEQPLKLHPLQQAFIDAGAVQCGYCTPGILMAAANLLAELPRPSPDQIRQALTGNLCRCTGYYKIIEAVERAAQMQSGYQCS